MLEDMEVTLRLLLDLQGGLNFRELRLSCRHAQGLALVEELVAACYNTLESLDIACKIHGTPNSVSLSDQPLN